MAEILAEKLNISIDSCKGNVSANFELDLNSVEDIAAEEQWLPVYVDNNDWKEIEFVCHGWYCSHSFRSIFIIINL